LQSDKIPFKYKSLIFNNLSKAFRIRVFAPEEESARKYALIFRGISVNPDRKTKICFQIESSPYCSDFGKKRGTYSEVNPQFPGCKQYPQSFL